MSANMKKVLTWVIIAFVGFYLITSPDTAAAGVRGVGSFFVDLFNGMGEFLSSVFAG